jgi:hypothetical protein
MPSGRLAAGIANWFSADIGPDIHAPRLLLSCPKTWFQWAFALYCSLSVIFLSTSMFKHRERFHHLLSSPGEVSTP